MSARRSPSFGTATRTRMPCTSAVARPTTISDTPTIRRLHPNRDWVCSVQTLCSVHCAMKPHIIVP